MVGLRRSGVVKRSEITVPSYPIHGGFLHSLRINGLTFRDPGRFDRPVQHVLSRSDVNDHILRHAILLERPHGVERFSEGFKRFLIGPRVLVATTGRHDEVRTWLLGPVVLNFVFTVDLRRLGRCVTRREVETKDKDEGL